MYGFLKRTFDIISSISGLIILSPLFITIIILIKLDSKGSVFFKQQRLGKDGGKIKIYKFRTMIEDAEDILKKMNTIEKLNFEKKYKFDRDPRITKIGKILRETSLDELPQLINILKGDMSIVGPRPILENELKKYGSFGDRLLTIKPGLTGYWQVNGRSNTTYEERIKLDMEYINNRNLWLDISILLKTIPVVYRKKGAM